MNFLAALGNVIANCFQFREWLHDDCKNAMREAFNRIPVYMQIELTKKVSAEWKQRSIIVAP